MSARVQNMMLQLENKGMLCSKSVKAKMNGSYVASLDRFSTKHGSCLQVEASKPIMVVLLIIFNPDTLY
ncbi:MAG: hypothetical protein R2774_11470 [Saprospiraceae bacterium]